MAASILADESWEFTHKLVRSIQWVLFQTVRDQGWATGTLPGLVAEMPMALLGLVSAGRRWRHQWVVLWRAMFVIKRSVRL